MLVRGVMIPRNTSAHLASARVDHTIFNTFSSCDIVRYRDLEACKFQMSAVREAGLLHMEGKNAIIQDGDIVTFKTKKH